MKLSYACYGRKLIIRGYLGRKPLHIGRWHIPDFIFGSVFRNRMGGVVTGDAFIADVQHILGASVINKFSSDSFKALMGLPSNGGFSDSIHTGTVIGYAYIGNTLSIFDTGFEASVSAKALDSVFLLGSVYGNVLRDNLVGLTSETKKGQGFLKTTDGRAQGLSTHPNYISLTDSILSDQISGINLKTNQDKINEKILDGYCIGKNIKIKETIAETKSSLVDVVKSNGSITVLSVINSPTAKNNVISFGSIGEGAYVADRLSNDNAKGDVSRNIGTHFYHKISYSNIVGNGVDQLGAIIRGTYFNQNLFGNNIFAQNTQSSCSFVLNNVSGSGVLLLNGSFSGTFLNDYSSGKSVMLVGGRLFDSPIKSFVRGEELQLVNTYACNKPIDALIYGNILSLTSFESAAEITNAILNAIVRDGTMASSSSNILSGNIYANGMYANKQVSNSSCRFFSDELSCQHFEGIKRSNIGQGIIRDGVFLLSREATKHNLIDNNLASSLVHVIIHPIQIKVASQNLSATCQPRTKETNNNAFEGKSSTSIAKAEKKTFRLNKISDCPMGDSVSGESRDVWVVNREGWLIIRRAYSIEITSNLMIIE